MTVKVSIRTETLKTAISDITNLGKSVSATLSDKANSSLDLSEENKELLQLLFDGAGITPAQRVKIGGYLNGNKVDTSLEVTGPVDLYRKLYGASTSPTPLFEAQLNGQWYPMMLQVDKFQNFGGSWVTNVNMNAFIGAHSYSHNFYITDGEFEESSATGDKKVKRTIKHLLESNGVRAASQEALDKHKEDMTKLSHFHSRENQVFDAVSSGIYQNGWIGWQSFPLGFVDSPATVIVDLTLENRYANHELMDNGQHKLPFVRVFSLKHKNFVYVDVNHLQKHVFHTDDKDKIVLPKNMMQALTSIFNSGKSQIFGDIFNGRHGGIVVMANGPSGVGKCLGKGTKVLMFDGTSKCVEDLVVGELLMGPDSTSRKILHTNTGNGKLCRIVPTKGDPWVCNDVHVLSLRNSNTGDVIDISLDEYMKSSNNFKNTHKLFSVGVDKFDKTKSDLLVDPYFMGVWFGDGSKHIRQLSSSKALCNVGVSTMDKEIVDLCHETAKKWNLNVSVNNSKSCPQYYIVDHSNDHNATNALVDVMRSLVGESVTIPQEYLTSSREDRLKFIAGYIDSDGDLSNNCFSITQKRKDWIDSIAFVARSLGFCCTVKEKKGGYKRADGTAFVGNYYRACISGNVSEIPTRLARKKASERKQIKNATNHGFAVEDIGIGDYYGFTLEGDGRFLLEDFTVTHNTLTAEVFAEHQERPLYVMEMSEVGTNTQQVEQNLQRIFARAKKWNAVLLFDEADIFLSERVASDLERSAIVGIFLRLLDYYEGTFFLTTNRGESIDRAFKSRVTLYLDYPELSVETRKTIWNSMLKSAGMEVEEDTDWSQINETTLNGRQIRNQVRLLKLMYPDNKVKTSAILASLAFAAK